MGRHKAGRCIIKVDGKLVPVVQYLLDHHPHELIPFSSCQGDATTPGLLGVVVRNSGAFGDFLRLFFIDKCEDLTVEMLPETISPGAYMVFVRWKNSSCNP